MVGGGEAAVAGKGGRRRVEGRESSVEEGGRGAAIGIDHERAWWSIQKTPQANDARATWQRAVGDDGAPGGAAAT